MVVKEDIVEVLKKVKDPEIHIDVWTLELIREIKIDDGRISILMTLTSPYCPYAPQLLAEMKQMVAAIEGVREVDIETTFDPPWEPSEELKEMLGTV